MDIDDPVFLLRLRSRDPSALEELARRVGPVLLRLARRLLDDDDAARDVRQEALIRAVANIDRFDGRARLGTWLYRVVVNLCRDDQRRTMARERAHQRALRDAFSDAQSDAQADALGVHDGARSHNGHALDPARVAARADDLRCIAFAVHDLPPLEREVIVLRHFHDVSFAEIADIQSAPVTTVKSRMARGLVRLESSLRELSRHD